MHCVYKNSAKLSPHECRLLGQITPSKWTRCVWLLTIWVHQLTTLQSPHSRSFLVILDICPVVGPALSVNCSWL